VRREKGRELRGRERERKYEGGEDEMRGMGRTKLRDGDRWAGNSK
jgi:hypothetical protein